MRVGLIAPAFAAVLAGAAAAARAQESLDEIDRTAKTEPKADTASATPSRSPVAEVNGYADNRFQLQWVNPNAAPVSTRDVPSLQDLLEANVQLKVNLGAKAFVYGDVSVLFQAGGFYYTDDVRMGVEFAENHGGFQAGRLYYIDEGRKEVDDHYVAALLPFIAVNELYANASPRPWLNLLAGKKRIVWGSGFAFNPTDLINPPKDPTDPNFQRAGAWLARVEAPFERFTVSVLAAPSVLYTANGLPAAMLSYRNNLPAGTTTDDANHYLLAARLYALIYDSDINLMYFFSNQYNDLFANKSRFGASFSRYFFTDYELHVEALFQEGSARVFIDPATHRPVNSKLDDGNIHPRVLVGGRTMFRDESLLSIEYYYQGDGYSDLEFEDAVRSLSLAKTLGVNPMTGGGGTGASPVKFTFDPLRRHYLIVSYNKPKIRDDWTVGATLIAGLRDLSGMLSPTVSWNAEEWLTLSLAGFIPIRGLPVGTVTVGGKDYSEYSLLPFDFRILFEARAFY